ncbi:MAG: orotate phosphoribosyltransferase, partial [Pseudomonadota bacterium]
QDADFKDIDLLFGPAYKGIPLTTCTATALYNSHKRNIACAFNRKEKKDHGEGGQLIGATIRGNIVIIDDVITAGTAVREVIALLKGTSAKLTGLVIGLNRQEKGVNGKSAISELEREFGIQVKSIISASHLLTYLEQRGEDKKHSAMAKYLETYGV